VVFYGNEISLGAFFGSWLLWIAAGAIAVTLLRRRGWLARPLLPLRILILALPLLLGTEVLALRVVRWLLDVSAIQLIPLGELFWSLLLINLPVGVALGAAFPLACELLNGQHTAGGGHRDGLVVRDVSLLYSLDAVGALLGGILFTFVVVEWLGVWRGLGGLTAALGIVAFALRARELERWLSLTAGAEVAIGLVVALTPVATVLKDRMEALRFETLQPGLELVAAVETRYGHVALARLGAQYSVVRDGRVAASFPQPRAIAQEAAYLYAQSNGAKRILSLGGVASGLVAELLRYPVERLDVVVPDRRAFALIRPYLPAESRQALEDPRLHLHLMDGRRFVNGLPEQARFDLVLIMESAPTSAYANRYFTLEFYQRLRAAMAPNGVLCTQVSSASNYLGGVVKSYSGSIYRTLRAVFAGVAVAPGDVQVFCASPAKDQVSDDPFVLERRYLDTPLAERRFPSLGFYSLLPRERVTFVQRQLEQAGAELNTDMHPVTYYLNMVLWGKFSVSEFVDWMDGLQRLGMWPYLIPPWVLVALFMLRGAMEGVPRPRLQRDAAALALVVLGLVAMAVQLTLIFSYQARVGFMFGRIALLNGIFMTGLALGAGGVGQVLARRRGADLSLAGLLVLLAVTLALLPAGLEWMSGMRIGIQEAVYLGLSAAAGLLVGVGFPFGVAQAQRDLGQVAQSSGLISAADNLGGALGGVLTGAILVPLLGMSGTLYLLAGYMLIALVPVLYARWIPIPVHFLRVRGFHSFPWPRLSWALLFVVLTVFFVSALVRGSQPPPQVRFNEAVLSAVSGSVQFSFRDTPIPHYLGSDAGDRETHTVSLASAAARAEVRGYAGPVHLLVSVDEHGILRGVRYLDSHETPSYIAGIRDWLAGLTGQDLSRHGLDLSRVDGLSGATVTSRAVLETINRAAAAGGEVAFSRHFAADHGGPPRQAAWSAPFWVTLALLLAFFPVYLSGREGLRLIYQAASLGVLGLWLNTRVTEIDLVNLSLGQWASLSTNPQRWLLLGFVAVSALAFGQAYCGYVCPFGALQEFISRAGRYLYLRSYPERPLERRMRFLKFVLLAVTLCVVWVSGESLWASFNPMQHLFGGHLTGWMGGIVALSLVGALFYYRFWCRYFCPFGAFLALSNKLAFLGRLAPKRRFEHCDLGVRTNTMWTVSAATGA